MGTIAYLWQKLTLESNSQEGTPRVLDKTFGLRTTTQILVSRGWKEWMEEYKRDQEGLSNS